MFDDMSFEEQKQYFLGEGEFTRFSDKLIEVVHGFGPGDPRPYALSIIANIPKRYDNQDNLWHKRSAAQIMDDGYVSGFCDKALLLETMLRIANVPTVHLETYRKEGKRIEEFIFLQFPIGNRWYTYDPIQGRFSDSLSFKDKEFTELGSGLDFSEIYLKYPDGYSKHPVNIDSYGKLDEIIFRP